MLAKINTYTLLYFIASILSLFFIDNDSMTELILKLFALTFLSFLYLSETQKINYWYVLVLLCSIASDAFFIFEDDFLIVAAALLFVNKILYIIIARRALFQTKLKTLLFYFTVCLLVFVIFYVMLKPYVEQISYTFILLGVSNTLAILFAFLNYLNKMNKENKHFLFGIFLIIFCDILMAFNKFLEYQILYVIIYTSIYYVARYLICRSLIIEKRIK
ncbi:YhhN-like protein [Tenacibaculum sp. 190524A02b]|uniref:lysoplasmalogenase family protein n=1 Tax=Tenacibaculum vairaonense TaxID=3137860 RepID=UPI003367E184